MSEKPPKNADWALSVFDKASIAGEMVIGLDVTTAKRAGDALAAEVRRLRREANDVFECADGTVAKDASVAAQSWADECRRLREREAKAREDSMSLLGVIADIRAAVGDPSGVMMLPELIDHCREILANVDRLKASEAKTREFVGMVVEANRVGLLDESEMRQQFSRWLAEGE